MLSVLDLLLSCWREEVDEDDDEVEDEADDDDEVASEDLLNKFSLVSVSGFMDTKLGLDNDTDIGSCDCSTKWTGNGISLDLFDAPLTLADIRSYSHENFAVVRLRAHFNLAEF